MKNITTSLFVCPVCGHRLATDEKSYRCDAGHCFDISAGGYVHLLPANRMNSHDPGDDKSMVVSRSRFLAKGYYAPLREALARLCVKYAAEGVCMLDLGCGEGYYTHGVAQALSAAGKKPHIAGVDIAKAAVRLAAKQNADGEFAVASVFHLPLADAGMDILVNCFSPLCTEEILRVLRPGGHFLYVVPGEMHLWGLKCAVYDTPYQNERKETPYAGLRFCEVSRIESDITLDCNEDIECLFRMTPYFWKTSKSDTDKLAALHKLDTPIAFDIHVYQKL